MPFIKVLSVCVCLLVALAPKTVLSVPVYGSTYALDGFTNVIIDGETWDVSFSDILLYDPSIHGSPLDAYTWALAANHEMDNEFITYKTDIEAALLLNTSNLFMPNCDVNPTNGNQYCTVVTADTVWLDPGKVGLGPALFVDVIDMDLSTGDAGVEFFDSRNLVTFANWTKVEATVPEPSVAILLTSGLIVFGVVRRKTRG